MNKTSDEFDKECGAKNDKWKGGKGVLEGRDLLESTELSKFRGQSPSDRPRDSDQTSFCKS